MENWKLETGNFQSGNKLPHSKNELLRAWRLFLDEPVDHQQNNGSDDGADEAG
jgi:hypothetical protein